MIRFKGAHFEKAIILTCVRWYVVYPLSNRQLEELTQERGVSVDHSTINRWVVAYRPQFATSVQGITASVVSARRGGRRSATCEKMTSGVDRVAARSTTSRKERTPCNTC